VQPTSTKYQPQPIGVAPANGSITATLEDHFQQDGSTIVSGGKVEEN
jgi:hypothetical protein